MKDLLKIIAGNISMTFAYAYLIVPNEIINGGVTSSALLLNALLGYNIAMLANLVTGLLLIICLVFLGKEYFFKSIVSSLSYMVFFNFFYSLNIQFDMNIVLVIFISSILIAIGYYLCITANASTVGFDVLALILHHKNEKIDIAATIRIINLIVLILGLLVYGYASIVKGIAFTLLFSYLLKKMLDRKQKAVTSATESVLDETPKVNEVK
ncbi:YitT family protein [Peribacillus castrilensis]|uniref:Yitt family protein n=1 Tax=Peribacillus simplex TaxID=1478 RepID=A0AAN2PGK7_9BACI|nr:MULTISPECIES: YitT family protein [Bacillaceae]MCF7622243.1 YitT family protein [Peribacillus frigoritolerans]MCP1152811.1 YitT family protein [Peribacillus frigoritolerans]MCT1388868.1 YitT family protein [Peribacillus frigoritolerans]MEA3574852.1 YitT family protein [Peribacillus frigoritolerans]NCT38643.1 YitT family protein [Peribacillus frigoritolerans]